VSKLYLSDLHEHDVNDNSITFAKDCREHDMQRELVALSDNTYDVLIIGGGIYGACIAWEATLRGLSVALVEKADFGSATSANSLKIIHGGLRYLQHADFKRIRESICERQNLMRMAPHLIHPLPVLMPTYGHGTHSKEVFALALLLNDVIGFDRNRQMDPQKHLPRGRVITKRECLRMLPDLQLDGLTGAAVFYDAQVYNSERFLLTCLQSASQAGAMLANYVEVTEFLTAQQRVTGVEVLDVLNGERFDIRAKVVVNTGGPWVDRVLGLLRSGRPSTGMRFAKAINIITRSLFSTYAVGLPGPQAYRDTEAVVNKGRRFLFVTPWRGCSLIGTTYTISDTEPDGFEITPQDVHTFLDDVNQAYPPANLHPEEVSFVHGGLVPISGTHPVTGDIQLAKHYQLYDHRREGYQGLISVVGVKYTTARHVAEKVVDHVFETWGHQPPRSVSAVTPLYGGDIEQFSTFLRAEIGKQPYGFGEEIMRRLIYNYGVVYPEVLRYMEPHAQCNKQEAIRKAEILYGIYEEMAQRLTDIMFRRTELGTIGHPGEACLRSCAEIMGTELGWNTAKVDQEISQVEKRFLTPLAQDEEDGSVLASATLQ
jgi:glycerol-3-phosphate dehydrogenase